MDNKSAIVGGFILGALALAVVAIMFFGGMQIFSKKTSAVVFFNESVAGLTVGAPVTFHGVQIGSVESIAVQFSANTLKARIPVYLQVDSSRISWQGRELDGGPADFARLVQAGLRAQLAEQSIVTGQLRVDLDFSRNEPAHLVGALPNIPEIPAVPSALGQFKDQIAHLPLRQLVDSAQHAFASVDRLSNHLDARLGPLADSVQRTADAATTTLRTTDDAVRQIKTGAIATLDDLDDLSLDARHQLDARSEDAGRTLADADAAIRQAQTLLDSLNGLMDPRSQFRADLASATHDLAASASSLRGFARTVERHPNALLMGRSDKP